MVVAGPLISPMIFGMVTLAALKIDIWPRKKHDFDLQTEGDDIHILHTCTGKTQTMDGMLVQVSSILQGVDQQKHGLNQLYIYIYMYVTRSMCFFLAFVQKYGGCLKQTIFG